MSTPDHSSELPPASTEDVSAPHLFPDEPVSTTDQPVTQVPSEPINDQPERTDPMPKEPDQASCSSKQSTGTSQDPRPHDNPSDAAPQVIMSSIVEGSTTSNGKDPAHFDARKTSSEEPAKQSNPHSRDQPSSQHVTDVVEISDDDEGDHAESTSTPPSSGIMPLKKESSTGRDISESRSDAEGDVDMVVNDISNLSAVPIQQSIEHDSNQAQLGEDEQSQPTGTMTDEQMAAVLLQYGKNTGQLPDHVNEVSEHPNQEAEQHEVVRLDDVDSEEEDLRAKDAFSALKKDYMRKVKAGNVNLIETIAFKAAQQAEESRKRARKGQKDYEKTHFDEEHAMFFPENEDSGSSDEEGSEGSSDDEEGAAIARTNTKDNDLKRGYAEIAEVEQVSEDDVEVLDPELRPPPAKKGRKNQGAAASNDTGSDTKSRTSIRGRTGRGRGGTRGRGGRGRGGGRGGRRQADQEDLYVVASLLPYDIFDQATKNLEAEGQPTTKHTRRKEALADLIASIPGEEGNVHIGDKRLLEDAIKSFNGRGAMRADGNGKWILKGMDTSLHHYQTIGAGRMRQRENEGKPAGGLLSDEMGLGKTVMTIANIVDGRPNPEDLKRSSRATLIITPAALQQQWYNEIRRHTNDKSGFIKNMMIYKSNGSIMNNPEGILGSTDVVITSYHEIIRSYPKKVIPPELVTERAKEEWWQSYFEQHKGALHRVKWHRIVLDEAQAIKNHLSRTSEGVWKLRGKYRWTLSGTPVVNSLEEFFAYFRFLKVFATGDFETWKRNFCKKGSRDALKRLQTMLEKMMIRRTHKDQLFGQPIIQLPPVKPVKTVELEFSGFERALYKIVRDRFVSRIKSWKTGGGLHGNYSNVFILLLRLRQLTAHMLLIQKTLKELLQIEDLEKLWSLTHTPEAQESEQTRAQVAGLVQGLNSVIESDPSVSSSPPDQTLATQTQTAKKDAPLSDLSLQYRKCLKAMRDDGQWAKANERSLCPYCGNPPVNPHVTSCLHIYCFACLNELAYAGLIQGEEAATCMECSVKFRKCEAYAAQAYNDADRSTPVALRASSRKQSSNPEEDVDWFKFEGPVIQSTKTQAAVKQIKEWWAEDEAANRDRSKILLFSQFRGVLRVLGRICEENGWGYAQFHGEMSFDSRNKAIEKFTKDPHCEVLLAAMKAGGVGLNLTAANRVILIDLWWNAAMEQQAYCRVFRIGQTRDVEVVRFAVKGTVDMDIIKMQDRKTKEINSAIDKNNAVGRLSTEELLRLFGPLEDQMDENQGGNDGDDDDDDGNGGDGDAGGDGKQKKKKKGKKGKGRKKKMSDEVVVEEPFIIPDDPYVRPDSDVEEGVEGGMIVDDEDSLFVN